MYLARIELPAAALPASRSTAPGFWPAWLDGFLARRAERDELLGLDSRELRDIGLTPTEALALAQRSLWRG